MRRASDLPGTIPVFPLPGALLLPRARLPLHIFEPRYLAMLDDCMKTPHRLIGMIQPRDGGASGAGGASAPTNGEGKRRFSAIGCAGRLTAFSETEDGRYMITLTGMSRYRLVSEVSGFTPYVRCDVSWDGFDRDLGPVETDERMDRTAFFALLERFFDTEGLKTDWPSLREAEDELLINSLAMLLPLTPEDKQALLEAPSLSTRRETLVTLIEFALRGGSGEELMQ